MTTAPYKGRFAPSPTGPLHAGSMVAALASWLDAKAHHGQWLVRMEDVDKPRCVPGAADFIMQQLSACGLHADAAPTYQSQRGKHYQIALDQLIAQNQAYACTCSRREVAQYWAHCGHAPQAHTALVYPGTCRNQSAQPAIQVLQTRAAWRFKSDYLPSPELLANTTAAGVLHTIIAIEKRVIGTNGLKNDADDTDDTDDADDTDAVDATNAADSAVGWLDRRLGVQSQNVQHTVGDFVLKRADGVWAYQLAVVVDDAAQAITHIVRGQDLLDNTARQILLQ
ncbi:MAG: tRNA glutamyl-Q(34) synthetase GluQRS, partial [Chitinophagaceae bacterium]|nr:tRNA glutamyl-Q(34) synthetase GluQRS [Polaromonas sp.]